MPRSKSAILPAAALALAGLGGLFLCGAGSGGAPKAAPSRVENTRRLIEGFERLRHPTSMAILQVDGFWARCKPWTFPRDRVIDCRPVIQEVPAPSRAWGDSLIELFLEPGVVTLPDEALVGADHEDVGLRFVTEGETTMVWLGTYAGDGAINSSTLAMWFTFTPVRTKVRSMLYAVLAPIEYESIGPFEYCDTKPALVSVPEFPREFRLSAATQADTVLFNALISRNGRVRMLNLKRGISGVDSLAASLAARYVFKPGLSGHRPVAAWTTIAIAVPKEDPRSR